MLGLITQSSVPAQSKANSSEEHCPQLI